MYQKLNYNNALDGLRGLGIFFALFYHADFKYFEGGFSVLDVFFVLSGYLITHLICDEIHETKTLSFSHFYLRRIRRLVPAILFLMVFIIPLWAIFCSGIPTETDHFLSSIAHSIVGFGNIYFYNNTWDYFDVVSSHRPLLHFWSLGVEEQFYFVWPLIIFLTHKFWGLKRVPWVMIFILVCSFAMSVYLVGISRSAAFYRMPPRAWELSCGGLVVFILPHIRNLKPWFWDMVSILCLGIVVYCNVFYDKSTPFPGVGALLPVLAGMGFIISFTKSSTGFNRIFHHKFLVRVGHLSYGLYLWHWPLFAILRINRAESVEGFILLILLSFLMSEISYRFIESPFRFGKWIKKFTAYQVMGATACLFVITIAYSQVLVLVDNKVQAEPTEFYQMMVDGHRYKKQCHGKLNQIGSEDCIVSYSEDPQIHFFVWGNSHAVAYAEFGELMTKDLQGKMTFASASRYPAFVPPTPTNVTDDLEKTGRNIHHKMFDMIKAETGRKVVIFANGYYAPFGLAGVPTESEIEYTIQQLINVNVEKIIIPLPNVTFKVEPRVCLSKKTECSVERSVVEQDREGVVQYLNELAKKYPQISLLDPLPILCPTEKCYLKLHDFPINEDREHMTARANRYLYEELKKQKGTEYLFADFSL